MKKINYHVYTLVTIVSIAILLLIIQIVFVTTPFRRHVLKSEPIFCAQDVRVCADGSFVSRIAPRCEFADCLNNAGTFRTYSNNQYGFELKYPSLWQEQQVSSVNPNKLVAVFINPNQQVAPDSDQPRDIVYVKINDDPLKGSEYLLDGVPGSATDWERGFADVWYKEIFFTYNKTKFALVAVALNDDAKILEEGIIKSFNFILD